MLVAMAPTALTARELGLIVNDADPASREVGEYYRQRRGIPEANVMHVSLPPVGGALDRERFDQLRSEILARTPSHVQAYAIAWTTPYRAGCMGLTAALALGFDEAYCSSACGETRASAYFNSASRAPYTDHGIRPAMMLAGASVAEVKALIDRGIAADFSYPSGTAYLVKTADAARNVRAAQYEEAVGKLGAAFSIERVEAGELRDRPDVMVYLTGAVRVGGLETLGFRPGAVADHLTSFGGQLTDSSQMSVLAWLSAGATASYGTVTEPCSHPRKFPHAGVLLWHYLNGASVIEAYWKSVAWPGEGVFVGEPLARPFGMRVLKADDGWRLESFSATPRRIAVETATQAVGPFRRHPTPLELPAGHGLVILPRIAPVMRLTPRRRRGG